MQWWFHKSLGSHRSLTALKYHNAHFEHLNRIETIVTVCIIVTWASLIVPWGSLIVTLPLVEQSPWNTTWQHKPNDNLSILKYHNAHFEHLNRIETIVTVCLIVTWASLMVPWGSLMVPWGSLIVTLPLVEQSPWNTTWQHKQNDYLSMLCPERVMLELWRTLQNLLHEWSYTPVARQSLWTGQD